MNAPFVKATAKTQNLVGLHNFLKVDCELQATV